MRSVSLVEESLARVVQVLAVLSGLVGENVLVLLQETTNVFACIRPPLAEVVIVLGIGVENIDGIEDGLHGSVVGETLEEDSEGHLGVGVGWVGADIATLACTLSGDILCTALVVVELVDEEIDGVVEVIMLLLFSDDLCKSHTSVKVGRSL